MHMCLIYIDCSNFGSYPRSENERITPLIYLLSLVLGKLEGVLQRLLIDSPLNVPDDYFIAEKLVVKVWPSAVKIITGIPNTMKTSSKLQ